MNRHDAQLALEKVIDNLGLSAATPTSDQIIAEYLRHALHTLSHNPTTVQRIYVTKLINQVKRQLSPLGQNFQETDSDAPIRRVLEQLKQVGDVAELGNGYWLPTPLRLVRLPNGKILLIGGMDTKSLQTRFGKMVQPSGFVRSVQSNDTTHFEREDIHWQGFEDWVGEAETDICTWTRNLLDEARQRLNPSASDLTDFEVYMPRLCKTNLQYYRWIQAQKLAFAPKDIVLCRFKQTFVTYYLGLLTGEKPVRLQRESRVEQDIEIRKLLYGLDALAQCSTNAKFELLDEKQGKLIFRSWLPATQRRLLLALGHEVHSRLPLVYEFSIDFKGEIFKHVQKLGISIIEDKIDG
ncbi:MAG: hypothetical protein VSS75_018310 [Candidatus Parabeggiatoa sp.]|nr:hypothetical protein [Candidatus Parabeggiatoa sp.]